MRPPDEAGGTSPSVLGTFWEPEAVTVVGASADPGKWGYWLARGALGGSERRPVHLVNRRGVAIEGHPSVRSLDEVDGPLGTVVLGVPPRAVPEAVDRALELGATGFLAITAGLDEALGRTGAQQEIADRIRGAGARLIGPNCLGIYDADSSLHLAWGEFTPGPVGIVSQSGQIGSEVALLAAERGLGVSRFVSVGNQVDVTAEEVLRDLVHSDRTRVVLVYLESFGHGRGLVRALQALRTAGKHVVLLTVGAGAASRGAARSHTGSMTSDLDVVEAACRAAGAVRVRTPTEAVELAQLLSGASLAPGRRVAVVGDSGGQGAVAADALEAEGLEVVGFPAGLRAELRLLLPPSGAVANPVDLAGAGEQDLETYARVVDLVAGSGAVDAVVLTGYFGSYAAHTPSLAVPECRVGGEIAAVPGRHGVPVVVHSMGRESSTISALRRLGISVYSAIEHVAMALGRSADLVERPGRDLGSGAEYARSVGSHTCPAGQETRSDDYLIAREHLAGVGVSFPSARAVADPEEVRLAARELTAPYVLKAGWLAHKTEVGGVVIGLAGPDAAQAAFEEMYARLGHGRYVLEEMDVRRDVVELIVGARHDPAFGPVVMVGAGGTWAELLSDTVVDLAPVDEAQAVAMLRRLRTAALLDGWRGGPPVAIGEAARQVAAISRLAVECGAAEIEVNPVRVGPDGAIAVDALVVAGPWSGGDGPGSDGSVGEWLDDIERPSVGHTRFRRV